MKYDRLTDKQHRYKKCVDCKYRNCQYCDDDIEYANEVHNRLAELETKIEQGKVSITKFARGQEVFYIAYNTIAYECPHCGEECYKEEIKGVEKGIICEKVITENQDGIEVVYTLQIEYKKDLPLFTKRTEEDIFLTREEAKKKLQEKEK